MTKLEALCVREKFAYDLLRFARSEKEKNLYKEELEKVRAEIRKEAMKGERP